MTIWVLIQTVLNRNCVEKLFISYFPRARPPSTPDARFAGNLNRLTR